MKAGEAGFQSTRDQRMKKRIQLRKTLLGVFFLNKKKDKLALKLLYITCRLDTKNSQTR